MFLRDTKSGAPARTSSPCTPLPNKKLQCVPWWNGVLHTSSSSQIKRWSPHSRSKAGAPARAEEPSIHSSESSPKILRCPGIYMMVPWGPRLEHTFTGNKDTMSFPIISIAPHLLETMEWERLVLRRHKARTPARAAQAQDPHLGLFSVQQSLCLKTSIK